MVKARNGWLTPDTAKEFSDEVARRLVTHADGDNARIGKLRLSKLGPQCPRALWYSVHHPELREILPPWVNIKLTYGHILEALAIAMAKESGHSVVGEQDELIVDGVRGHRDCVIDGCIVDVKSANSRTFEKIKSKAISKDDLFGYLDQLDGYLVGSLTDDLVTVKDRAYLLVIDKVLGHLCLYEHRIREEYIRDRIRSYKEIVDRDTPPACLCRSVPDGQSGNLKLDTKASYSSYKYCCFPHLRTFLYANGPVHLTKVVRRPAPHIAEVNKDGQVLFTSA